LADLVEMSKTQKWKTITYTNFSSKVYTKRTINELKDLVRFMAVGETSYSEIE